MKKGKIQIKSVLIPLCLMCILSMAYNLAFILLATVVTDLMYTLVQIVLGLISSVGFYWLCTKIWKQGELSYPIILKVLSLELLYLFLVVGVLQTLSGIIGGNVILQIVGFLLLVFMLPIQVLYFYALSEGNITFKDIFGYVWNIFKNYSRSILNLYCALLLVVIMIDTMFGGMLSMGEAINTPYLAMSVLLYGNPMMDWMMYMFMASVMGYGEVAVYVNLVVFIVKGLIYAFMIINFVLSVSRKCIEYGTRKDQINKKKDRTSK